MKDKKPVKEEQSYQVIGTEAYTNCVVCGREIVYMKGYEKPMLCTDLSGFFGCQK